MTARRDRVRVTTFVRVSPADAFEVFTQETDRWWRRTMEFRRIPGAAGVIRFEGGVDGRLIEAGPDRPEVEIGRIRVWEPGARLVFSWHARNFGPSDTTEVEVTFVAKHGGTEVTLEHRGWAAIPDDHPVRHGTPDAAFNATMAGWWGSLASAYREHAASRSVA